MGVLAGPGVKAAQVRARAPPVPLLVSAFSVGMYGVRWGDSAHGDGDGGGYAWSDWEAEDRQCGAQTLCGDFKRGLCSRGDRCTYVHANAASAEMCGDFKRGMCARGDRSKFAHSDGEDARGAMGKNASWP